MGRTSFALVCASVLLFAAGLVWPDASWAQAGSKRPPPQGAPVSGRAVERAKGQTNEGRSEHAVEAAGGRAVVRVGERDAWMDRDRCRVIVTQYYDRRSLPPGLGKRNTLPPGLRKQLRERGHVPPGLERHWVILPVELERRLPPLPPHYVRRAVGEDLLVIDVRANLVVSVMALSLIHI